MTTGASDAELVRAHVAGDRAALASIYDRYAPSLFDTATALLGDRDEAADVVQDTFLAAHQHLARLRDPSRLRSWLFAVARHEVERRGRKRRRAVPTATVADMAPAVTPDLGADVQGTELAAMVRAAAAGLDERDQLVLELSMRQGLEGADLAAALGVTPAQSYSLVFRMRERVSRALGALVVARTGRRDCAELAAILQGWDGTFSVLIRKRVARHVEQCDTCERTRARAALPALMSVAPAFALPIGLRDRVLSQPAGEPMALELDDEGFPRSNGRAMAPRRPRWPVTVGAAVVAAAVLAGGTALLASRDHGPQQVIAEGTAPVVAEPTSEASTSAVPTATTAVTVPTIPPLQASTTAAPPPTVPPTPPPTPVPPARLGLSSTSVALGGTQSAATVTVRNEGGSPLTWSVEEATGPVEAGGGSTLAPGSQAPLAISVDRAALPEGELVGTVVIQSSVGSAVIRVTGLVERPPEITAVTFAERLVRVGGCAPRAAGVTVAVSDESPVEVRMTVTSPAGRPAAVDLQPAGGGRWTGLVGPFARAGSATVEVVAVDARGNEATASRTLPAVACST